MVPVLFQAEMRSGFDCIEYLVPGMIDFDLHNAKKGDRKNYYPGLLNTHFGHENVLKFTDRPWETIWQMNDAIVDNINGRVAVDDELYILGDFSFKMTAQDAYGLRKRIACKRIHLVPGNHDKDWTQPAVAGAFTVEPPICVLKIDGQKIVLCHYPMADWQGMSHGSWHLHGHIHSGGGAYNEFNRKQGLLRYDVGCDAIQKNSPVRTRKGYYGSLL